MVIIRSGNIRNDIACPLFAKEKVFVKKIL